MINGVSTVIRNTKIISSFLLNALMLIFNMVAMYVQFMSGCTISSPETFVGYQRHRVLGMVCNHGWISFCVFTHSQLVVKAKTKNLMGQNSGVTPSIHRYI